MSRMSAIVVLIVAVASPVAVMEWMPTAAAQSPLGTTVTPLGMPTGCTGSRGFGINATGAMVGSADGCSGLPGPSSQYAVRFDPPAEPSLVHAVFDPATGSFSEWMGGANGITDSGVVVGSGAVSGNLGILTIPGGLLPALPGATNQFGGYINNAGEVVGTTVFDPQGGTSGHATLRVGGSASRATIADGQGAATILDNDP